MIQHPARRLAWAATISTVLLAGCFGSTAQEDVSGARVAMEKGDRNTAIVQLKNALQKNPDMADARYLLARNLYESGNPQSAGIELDKAAKLGFSETSIAPLRARLMLLSGENGKLVEQFSGKKLNGTAEQVDLMTSVAMALSVEGKVEPALRTLDEALKLDPSNRRAQLVRIRCLRVSASPEVAMRELEAFLAKDSKDSDAWQLKGEILLTQGKADEAIDAYRQSVSLRKKNMVAQTALITLLLDKKDLVGAAAQIKDFRSVAPRSPQAEFLAAALAFERNDLKEANERIQRVLKIYDKEPRALQLAASIDIRRGALLEAEARLGKLLAINPDNVRARLLQAQLQLRLGNATKANALLQPLLDAPPLSVEVLELAAEIQVALGDSRAADDYLTTIVARKPDDPRARVALAMSAIRDGKLDRGIAQLRAVASTDPGIQADLALVDLFVQQKNYSQALATVDALEHKMSGKAAIPTLRGRINADRGEREKARQNLEAALKIDTNYYPALAALVALDASSGRLNSAMEHLQGFVKENPKHVRAQLALLALREKGSAKPEDLIATVRSLIGEMPSEVELRVVLIDMQIKRKENKLALAAAQEATAAFPDAPEVWMALGRVQGALGEFEQAAAALNKVITLRPNQPQSYLPLAELYASRKDRVSAGRALNRALGIKADYLPAQVALVQLAMAAGAPADAQKVAKSLQSQHPQDPVGFIIAGDIASASQSWDAAVQNYRTALSKGGGNEAAVKLHNALLAAKRDGDASKFASEWLKSHPDDVLFMQHLGTVAMARNELDSAETQFRAILKLYPGNLVALNNLAWILNKTKKPGALEMAEMASALAPNQAPVLDTLAETYAQAGQTGKAVEMQKKAVALAPEIGAYRLNLARYYVMAGQKAAAREELKRLAALGDKLPQQKEVQKLLGSL